jgi:hypothetical protein
MNWETIWQVVFIGILLAFALMAVLVTVLGAMDVRQLITRLRDAETARKHDNERE